jgi:hypothetical protein
MDVGLLGGETVSGFLTDARAAFVSVEKLSVTFSIGGRGGGDGTGTRAEVAGAAAFLKGFLKLNRRRSKSGTGAPDCTESNHINKN